MFSGEGETISSYIGTGQYHSNKPVNITADLKAGKTYTKYLKYESNKWSEETSGSTSVVGNTIKHTDIINSDKKYALDTEYDIHLDLAGGEGIDNTDFTYTVNEDVTIDNPTKVGYTFLGWTGSNGDTPQKSLAIPKYTEVGDKEYVANWRKMQLKLYTPTQIGVTAINQIIVYDVDSNGLKVQKQVINNTAQSIGNVGLNHTIDVYPGGWVEFKLSSLNSGVHVFSNNMMYAFGIYDPAIGTGNRVQCVKFKVPSNACEDAMLPVYDKVNNGTIDWEYLVFSTASKNYGTYYYFEYQTEAYAMFKYAYPSGWICDIGGEDITASRSDYNTWIKYDYNDQSEYDSYYAYQYTTIYDWYGNNKRHIGKH